KRLRGKEVHKASDLLKANVSGGQGMLKLRPGLRKVLARREARFSLVEQHHEQVSRCLGQRPQLVCGVLVGSIRLFVGEAVEQLYPRACVNRSPNMMANRFIADSQSKAARTDLFSTLRSASHGSLMAASSSGK